MIITVLMVATPFKTVKEKRYYLPTKRLVDLASNIRSESRIICQKITFHLGYLYDMIGFVYM